MTSHANSDPVSPTGHEHKFLTLDAMRGLAALVVVQWHSAALFGRVLFPHGYLSVDFFFLLSGFVLTLAYQQKLDAGWPTSSFLKSRLFRLYPLYILGLVLGIIGYVIEYGHNQQGPWKGLLACYMAFGVCVLPIVTHLHIATGWAFPLNYPTWSLFGEGVANAGHAVLLRRRSPRFFLWAAATTGTVLIGCIIRKSTLNFGFLPSQGFLAIPRVAFPYILGVVLYQKWRTSPYRQVKVPVLLPCMLLLGVFLLPDTGRHTALYDLIIAFIVFPVTLLLGAQASVSRRFVPIFTSLGLSSYALYVLHVPLQVFYIAAFHALHRDPGGVNAPWSGICFVAVALAAALLAEHFYDLPARSYFKQRHTATPARGIASTPKESVAVISRLAPPLTSPPSEDIPGGA